MFEIYLDHLQSRHLKDITISGNILYIEDAHSLADKTTSLLRRTGYDVSHFSNAADALAAFKQQPFDLVLTDLVLEGSKSE